MVQVPSQRVDIFSPANQFLIFDLGRTRTKRRVIHSTDSSSSDSDYPYSSPPRRSLGRRRAPRKGQGGSRGGRVISRRSASSSSSPCEQDHYSQVSDEPESDISSDAALQESFQVSYQIPFVSPAQSTIISTLAHQLTRPHQYNVGIVPPQIDAILAQRDNFDDGSPRPREYLVKWKQRSHLCNTWLSRDQVVSTGAQRKLQNFEQNQQHGDPLAHGGDADLGTRSPPGSNKDVLDLEVFKTVERVLDEWPDEQSGQTFYLCKWTTLPYTECTWEPAAFVEAHSPRLIDEFHFRSRTGGIPTCPPNHYRRATFCKLAQPPEYLQRCGRLRDYQLEAVNWLCYSWCHGNNVILADEMGLGKTVQSIAYIVALVNEYNFTGPVLVVVPLSTIAAWQKEFARWAPDLNTLLYIGDGKSRGIQRYYDWFADESAADSDSKLRSRLRPRHSDAADGKTHAMPLFHVLLTTYELVLKDQQHLEQVDWRLLLVDEGHRLKNASSQLHSVLDAISPYSRLLITGTPLQNSLRELWSLLHFLMPAKFSSYPDFIHRYGAGSCDASGQVSGERLEELHRLLKPHLLRRMKCDVEASLPAKVERILRVELTEEQKHLSRLILTKNYRELASRTKSVTSLSNILMELKKVCNHPRLLGPGSEGLIHSSGKMIILDQLMRRLHQDGHRVLIFSQMVRMLDILEQYLRLRGWKFQRLDGSVASDARRRAIASFNASGSDDFCFLLSTRAGGLGINLETADTVIIYDSDWNPQNDLQAMARAHRIGQTRSVNIYRLICKASVEETILERAKQKMILDHLVIQSMTTADQRGGGGGASRNGIRSSSQGLGAGAKTTRDELQFILKFGAADLFNGDGAAGVPPSKFDLDELLARADDGSTNASAGGEAGTPSLFDRFKVADFELKEWSKILPEGQVREAETLAAEEERMEREVALQEALLTTANKRKSRAARQEDGRSSAPAIKTPCPKTAVKSPSTGGRLSREAHRALLSALLKYGIIPDRLHTILQDVRYALLSTTANLCSEGDLEQDMLFLRRQVEETEHDSCRLGDNPPLHVNLAQLRDRHRLLSFLHSQLGSGGEGQEERQGVDKLANRLSLDAGRGIKSVATSGAHRWMIEWETYKDDARLLIGVYRHGFGEWLKIAEDQSLNLTERLEQCLGQQRSDPKFLPKELHLGRRVENLLNHMIRNTDLQSKEEASKEEANKEEAGKEEAGKNVDKEKAAKDTTAKRMRRLLKPVRDQVSFIASLTADGVSESPEQVCSALFEIGNAISTGLATVGEARARPNGAEAENESYVALWDYLASFWPTEITGQELERLYQKIDSERSRPPRERKEGGDSPAKKPCTEY